jgi:hypothetical protein
MKKQSHPTPTRSKLSVFRQLCNLIPTHLVSQLARDTGVEEKCRSFKPWSHVVSLLFAQFTHALGLNDVSDSLRLHSGPLSAIRGAPPPSRNGLSTANRQRPAALAEQLFWQTLEHLQSVSPAFGAGRSGKRLAHRFKTAIHVVDATTIQPESGSWSPRITRIDAKMKPQGAGTEITFRVKRSARPPLLFCVIRVIRVIRGVELRFLGSTGRLLPGLGQTPPPQGRRQVPSAAGFAQLPAALRSD